MLHNVSQYFDNRFHYDWLEDEFVIQMILDVDQSIVESPMCIKSPVLRQIPPTKLSGGASWNLMKRNLKLKY